jgi:ABC-2 type transport system ATP-binding protein
VLFSTHVMQHAERLCDRILLLAKGRKIFDGTIGEAKETIPRRVRIETRDDIAPLRELPEVVSISDEASQSLLTSAAAKGVRLWELELRDHADPQSILQACFARGIRLQSFNQSEPTLHEVFMRLVGPDAKEALFR